MTGVVHLVGAGPGDPGLLTLRGMQLLQSADVVVYDRLVHPSLLQYVPRDADRVFVGKESGRHAVPQEQIEAILITGARAGKQVVRLKGGDPFVFGRGGEEAEACRAAGVPFTVTPGISSAIAAPAYAGIPVTHRDMASSFAVITGHERAGSGEAACRRPGRAEGRRRWAELAQGADTLVLLMGVESLPDTARRLIENGRPAETPAAVIQWGTLPRQKTVVGTLGTIAELARSSGITAPAVCVVGEVAQLRNRLQWFDDRRSRPLFGRRVIVTRAREQASALSSLLSERGAEPVECPAISIQPVEDTSDLDAALSRLSEYRWVVFTSANAPPILARRLAQQGLDARSFGAARVAAMGPATAEALRQELGIRADYVPTEAIAEALAAEWPDQEMAGARVLLPRALEARSLLVDALAARGAQVDDIPLYRTVPDQEGCRDVAADLAAGTIDAITFTASSTVRNFAHLVSGEAPLAPLLAKPVVAAIGPVTAATLAELGVEPDIVAEEHTMPGLVLALEDYYSAQRLEHG